MKIFDVTKTKELKKEDCDLNLGYLKSETILIGKRKSLKEITKDKFGNIMETTYPSLEITEDVLVYTPFTEQELKEQEIQKLEEWFASEYREQFEKCTRRIAMGTKMRNGDDPKETLSKLYQEAEEKANKINQLRDEIGQ